MAHISLVAVVAPRVGSGYKDGPVLASSIVGKNEVRGEGAAGHSEGEKRDRKLHCFDLSEHTSDLALTSGLNGSV